MVPVYPNLSHSPVQNGPAVLQVRPQECVAWWFLGLVSLGQPSAGSLKGQGGWPQVHPLAAGHVQCRRCGWYRRAGKEPETERSSGYVAASWDRSFHIQDQWNWCAFTMLEASHAYESYHYLSIDRVFAWQDSWKRCKHSINQEMRGPPVSGSSYRS